MSQRPSARRRMAIVVWQRWLAPTLVGAVVLFAMQGLLVGWNQLRGWPLSWMLSRVRSSGPRPDPRFLVVGIDKATLADPRIPHWGLETLDRRAHAQVLRQLHDAGAAAVGLDIVFDRPADDPFSDTELAAAMGEAGPVVLAVDAEANPDRDAPARFIPPPDAYWGVERLRLASPTVRRWLTTQNVFGIEIDQRAADGRTVNPLSYELFEATHEAHGRIAPHVVGLVDPHLIAIRWPAAPAGGDFTIVSYREIWDGSWLRAHPGAVAGRAVLVGGLVPGGAGDVLRTPVGSLPGVLVHAAALQTLLDGSFPVRWWATSLWIAVAAFILVTLAAYRWPLGWVALGTAGLVAGIWATSQAMLAATPSVWINPISATMAAATALGTRLFWQSITARRALARFVSPELAQELAATGRVASWREGQREATVLFSDIRDYTTLSESMAPDATLRLLNDHFAWMDGVIEAHGGRVDKHVGDAVMAVFEGPRANHAAQAAAAAAALVRGALDSERQASGIRFGIGVHSGTLARGELGGKKFEYAAIGDTVNVAARLESATKELGVPVLISAATASRLPSREALVPLGEIALKGKSEPLAVYGLDPLAAGAEASERTPAAPGASPPPVRGELARLG